MERKKELKLEDLVTIVGVDFTVKHLTGKGYYLEAKHGSNSLCFEELELDKSRVLNTLGISPNAGGIFPFLSCLRDLTTVYNYLKETEEELEEKALDKSISVFVVGARVYDMRKGWGTVESVESDIAEYPVSVRFDKTKAIYDYTIDGKFTAHDINPILSFMHYHCEGFSLKREDIVTSFEEGQIVYYLDCDNKWSMGKYFELSVTGCHVIKVISSNSNWVIRTARTVSTTNPYTV
jgi:hypothetical protein